MYVPGGGVLWLIFAGYHTPLRTPYPILVYFGAILKTPPLSLWEKKAIFAIPT